MGKRQEGDSCGGTKDRHRDSFIDRGMGHRRVACNW